MMFIRRIFRDFSLHYFEKARHPSTRKTNSMILLSLSLSYSFLSFEKSNELLSNMRRKEEEEEKKSRKETE